MIREIAMLLMDCILWEPPTRLEAIEDGWTVFLYELLDRYLAAGGCDGGCIGSTVYGRLATREQVREHLGGEVNDSQVIYSAKVRKSRRCDRVDREDRVIEALQVSGL
jgi:hypothetical protein